MTTANLVVNYGKEKISKLYWCWSDGYQVDNLIEKEIRKAKDFKFTDKQVDALLKNDELNFEDATEDDGRGDWAWVLTVIDRKHATLTGAGSGEVKTKWIEIE